MDKSTNRIRIRRGSSSDLPTIYELVRQLAAFENAPQEFTASRQQYIEDFRDGWFETLVAEYDGQLSGMALFYPTYSTWKGRMLYLEDFIVRENYRSRGIGKLLFEAFLDEARSRSCRIVKWQVLDWNTDAIRFYERYSALTDKEWWNMKIYL